MEATVAERGRITLPKAVRDALGLTKGSKLKFELEDGRIVLRKDVGDAISRLRGRFKLAEGFNMNITTDFGQIEAVIQQKIDQNRGRVRVAADLSKEGIAEIAAVLDDFRAPGTHGRHLVRVVLRRHDQDAADVEKATGEGQRLAVVAGGAADDAGLFLFGR